MIPRRFHRLFVIVAVPIVLVACARQPESPSSAGAPGTIVAPAPSEPAQRAANAIAGKVEAKAKRGEKAEGKQDLVKDQVQVKTGADGNAVVEQVGEGSWYGRYHHGRKTSTGARFDQNALTAAHPTLPLGTKATVTNLETGKSVEVTINDRGPYARGRDIDLSKAAAQRIGVGKNGAVPVKIDAVVTPSPPK